MVSTVIPRGSCDKSGCSGPLPHSSKPSFVGISVQVHRRGRIRTLWHVCTPNYNCIYFVRDESFSSILNVTVCNHRYDKKIWHLTCSIIVKLPKWKSTTVYVLTHYVELIISIEHQTHPSIRESHHIISRRWMNGCSLTINPVLSMMFIWCLYAYAMNAHDYLCYSACIIFSELSFQRETSKSIGVDKLEFISVIFFLLFIIKVLYFSQGDRTSFSIYL